MGWKHTPARWWKDEAAERAAYDASMERAHRGESWYATVMFDEIEIRLPVFTHYPILSGTVTIQ